MAAVLPETDGESNSGELRTAATVGSGGVVLPARTHTVNYGSRNNKRVRVRGDLQGAVGGGGWRHGARERKEGGETNPATDAATNGDDRRRRRAARKAATADVLAPGSKCGARRRSRTWVWVACTVYEAGVGSSFYWSFTRRKNAVAGTERRRCPDLVAVRLR